MPETRQRYSTLRFNGTPPVPLPIKDRDKVSGEETGETRLLFKTVFVFDRAQVAPLPNGTPTLLEAPCEPLTGDSHTHLITPPTRPGAGGCGRWCTRSRTRWVSGTPSTAVRGRR
jgi:hypothetical protein